jgi:hypothetical protein
MPEFSLKNFDEFITQVKDIKTELAGDKIKAEKKEKRENRRAAVTFAIAVTSFMLSIFSIFYNTHIDTRNYKLQRETQAYSFWLSYLELASNNSDFANGKDTIDNIPIDSLARRDSLNVSYAPTTVSKFVAYAWFVAKALGTAEIVSELTDDDKEWEPAIDTIIRNHRAYISSCGFNRTHYGSYMRERFDKVVGACKR